MKKCIVLLPIVLFFSAINPMQYSFSDPGKATKRHYHDRRLSLQKPLPKKRHFIPLTLQYLQENSCLRIIVQSSLHDRSTSGGSTRKEHEKLTHESSQIARNVSDIKEICKFLTLTFNSKIYPCGPIFWINVKRGLITQKNFLCYINLCFSQKTPNFIFLLQDLWPYFEETANQFNLFDENNQCIGKPILHAINLQVDLRNLSSFRLFLEA